MHSECVGKMKNYLNYLDESKQISSTGTRALIVFFGILASPKTYEEITEFLISSGIITGGYSIDTLRMDLNTLKAIGCEIDKATKKNNFKYTLLNHPFKVEITPMDICFLKEAYKSICKTCSPSTLLEYHKLFLKLSTMTESEETKETILGISLLKGLNIELIEELVADEEHNNKVQILYQPSKTKEVTYDITLEKLGMRSNKLYAFCFNHTLGKRTFLNVVKIKKILCKYFDRTVQKGFDVIVKFKLSRSYLYQLEPTETILDSSDDVLTIEGMYFNMFIATQRILSFGKDCIVIEPEDFREQIIEKFLEMRELYSRGKKN